MRTLKLASFAVVALLAVASCSRTPPPAPTATCPASSMKLPLRAVVGSGTDVFVANITANGPVEERVTGPIQTYLADASAPLMGSANGPVRIGVGSVLINGKPCRDGIPLPEVGKSYLIAANYNKASQIFVAGVFEGSTTELTDTDIAKIGTPDEPMLIKDMREAVKAPIYPTI